MPGEYCALRSQTAPMYNDLRARLAQKSNRPGAAVAIAVRVEFGPEGLLTRTAMPRDRASSSRFSKSTGSAPRFCFVNLARGPIFVQASSRCMTVHGGFKAAGPTFLVNSGYLEIRSM